MRELNSFNVRAYAICVHENKVLSVKEKYEDVVYSKLPGGGLEFGEGLIECLHRV
jgi:ADP-ribose pyrophosphatase YjhB (NUDIX family)